MFEFTHREQDTGRAEYHYQPRKLYSPSPSPTKRDIQGGRPLFFFFFFFFFKRKSLLSVLLLLLLSGSSLSPSACDPEETRLEKWNVKEAESLHHAKEKIRKLEAAGTKMKTRIRRAGKAGREEKRREEKRREERDEDGCHWGCKRRGERECISKATKAVLIRHRLEAKTTTTTKRLCRILHMFYFGWGGRSTEFHCQILKAKATLRHRWSNPAMLMRRSRTILPTMSKLSKVQSRKGRRSSNSGWNGYGGDSTMIERCRNLDTHMHT